jgi:amino acid adenylation domain-containing protein
MDNQLKMEATCSYHQERLWFIDNFEKGVLYPDSPVYHNLPLILEIEGEIDLALLEKSVLKIIREHDALWTSIQTKDGHPVQCIDKTKEFRIYRRALPDTLTEEERMSCYLEIASSPFTLDGDLFRIDLLEFYTGKTALILTAHHGIADRYSLKTLARLVCDEYNGKHQGQEQLPGSKTITFSEYAAWQKSFSSEMVDELVLNWKARLKNIQPLALHTDRQRAPVHIYEYSLSGMSLPFDTLTLFRTFADRHQYKTEVVLLAVFNLLLHKYAGQNNVAIGILTENRDLPVLKNVIGPISNLLTLNSTIKPDDIFLDVIQEVSENYEQAIAYKDLPFDRLVSELSLPKDMSRTALFDVLFHFEETSRFSLEDGAVQVKEIETNSGMGKYDLNLLAREDDHGLELFLTYNKAYFNESTIRNMLKHFSYLLENALLNHNQQVNQIDLISREEQLEWSRKFDLTSAENDDGFNLVTAFELQVKRYPDNVALESDGAEWSYRQLNDISNQLSCYLSALYGVKSENVIAIKLEKSEWQIITLLAVLKAGAAYVPIDPSYPGERIQLLLQDSGSELCIDEALISSFVPVKDNYGCADRKVDIWSGQLAYIIYTSGSTGKPKGALLEHRNVMRLFNPALSRFDFSSKDTWTFFHSFSFDFSVWEMFGALLSGGKLVIVPKDTARDPQLFKSLLQEQKVTVLNQTPTAFFNLQELVSEKDSFSLRYVIFGGEKLSFSKLEKWNALFPKIRLINMYGITETGVHTTYKEILDTDIFAGISNIGVPLPAVSCLVLDEFMHPLPALITGELYVGGLGVARGYHNRPDLTAARFIENPMGAGRLFKTGDKVKILTTGELEYIGRLDDQVKIRGFRIEPAEIERALLSYEPVEDAVVLIKSSDDPRQNRLIGFLKTKEKIQLSQLTAHLKNLLPSYMIPEGFVYTSVIPLNANGKVDKNFLLDRMDQTIVPDTVYKAPSDEIESKLVEIWEQVLGRDKIGVNDDFFYLGGHSLNVMEVLTKIEEEYHLQIRVKSFFVNPTIEHLAHEVKAGKWAQYEEGAVAGARETSIVI